jgi:hypothetical protein
LTEAVHEEVEPNGKYREINVLGALMPWGKEYASY